VTGTLCPNSQHRVSLTRFSVPLIPNTQVWQQNAKVYYLTENDNQFGLVSTRAW
jgi:hypothetical protein